MNDRHREIRAAIDRYGWYAPAVLPDVPAAPTWTYTIGMHEIGLPELIVFGEAPDVSHRILGGIRDLLVSRPSRARVGESVGEFTTCRGRIPARLGSVHPRWIPEFPLWALDHYGPVIEVMQVVLADEDGRFWEHADFHTCRHHRQPDLALDDRPWRAPFWPTDWLAGAAEPDLWVLAPIVHAGQPEHRDEAVPAQRIDERTARILQPPVLADRQTAGAVVVIDPLPDAVLSLPHHDLIAPSHRMGELQHPGERVHLAYALVPGDEAHVTRLVTAIEEICHRFDAEASFTVGSMHLAVPRRAGEPARIAFRRLERDGLVRALQPYHAISSVHDSAECPRCRRERPGG